MNYLTVFFEIFRFIKRYRERQDARLQREADERAAERAHQRALLETIFSKMVESQKVQSESIMALADSQRATANVMQTWLDGFKISDPSPQRPSVANNDEEEWLKEQLQLAKLGLPADIDLSQLPPEFKLAYELAHSNDDEG
jgi:hypothetical protein